MRELVENDRRQLDVVPADHGIEDGIVEVAQGRIGGHPGDAHVEPLALQGIAEGSSAPLDEVAAIRDATDDGIAPFLRLDGEFRSRDDVPDHVGPAHIGISAVAAVVRQVQVAAGELANLRDRLELLAHVGGRARIGDDPRDRAALGHERELALRALQQVAAVQGHADQYQHAQDADP